MKVGDLVQRKVMKGSAGMTIQGFGPGDIGMIVNFPDHVGDVVDIVAKGIKIRYWIEGLYVITHLPE
jgi:hypothetical protein